jgi:hypothetical protein
MKKIVIKNIILVLILFNFYSTFSQQADSVIEASFMPAPGKYIVSGWVKETGGNQKITYSNSSIQVYIDGIPAPAQVFSPAGAIIDGWQRILGILTIFEGTQSANIIATAIKITLDCTNSQGSCYFDDIRFFPYNGNMKSFVYDEDTQRLMAELDENNYATFYEYDLEGGLVRVKKETEKGVFTIQETRSNTVKREENKSFIITEIKGK